jgi:transcriptional regulator with XRE-family HTH domain
MIIGMTDASVQLGAHVGSRLADRRRDRRLSGQQLAVSAGLSIDTVRSIESGRIPNPGIVTMARLAAVLEASLDEMTGLSPQHTEGATT